MACPDQKSIIHSAFSTAIRAVVFITFTSAASVSAQTLGIGIGGDDGLSADVGSDSDGVSVGANLGGDDGVNADATVGGDSGSGDTPPANIGGVTLQGVSPQLLAAAQRMPCKQGGNSSVYDGFVVFGPEGRALGVVQDASVSRNLDIESLRMATMPRDGLASSCVTIRTTDVRLGNGALVIPVRWDRLANSLTR